MLVTLKFMYLAQAGSLSHRFLCTYNSLLYLFQFVSEMTENPFFVDASVRAQASPEHRFCLWLSGRFLPTRQCGVQQALSSFQ